MRIGLNGSPTTVRDTFVPMPGRKGIVVEGHSGELAEGILDFLSEKKFVTRRYEKISAK